MSIVKPLKRNYDLDCDALMLYCGGDYDYSLEVCGDVIIDLDNNGVPCAFEFLNASKLFKLDKSDLTNIKKLQLNIKITSKLIELNTLIFGVNHKSINLQNTIANIDNLASLNLNFV